MTIDQRLRDAEFPSEQEWLKAALGWEPGDDEDLFYLRQLYVELLNEPEGTENT